MRHITAVFRLGDAKGEAAPPFCQGVDPFYMAPPLKDVDDPYASGRYWSPSDRHSGKTVVGFIGGHVLRSEKPKDEKWDWSYQAELGR